MIRKPEDLPGCWFREILSSKRSPENVCAMARFLSLERGNAVPPTVAHLLAPRGQNLD